jgi:hypothetical protein
MCRTNSSAVPVVQPFQRCRRGSEPGDGVEAPWIAEYGIQRNTQQQTDRTRARSASGSHRLSVRSGSALEDPWRKDPRDDTAPHPGHRRRPVR